jgi:hypothetical protein
MNMQLPLALYLLEKKFAISTSKYTPALGKTQLQVISDF